MGPRSRTNQFQFLKLAKHSMCLFLRFRITISSTKKTSLGISFDIPLHVLENIFDFWLDKYKSKQDWETCLGLLKTKKRFPLSKLINSGSLKGNSKKWAIEIETLHSYKPNLIKNIISNEPMWK